MYFSSFLHIMHRCQIEIKYDCFLLASPESLEAAINQLSVLIIDQVEQERIFIEIWRRHDFRFVPDHHGSNGTIKKISLKLKETFCYESNSFCSGDQSMRSILYGKLLLDPFTKEEHSWNNRESVWHVEFLSSPLSFSCRSHEKLKYVQSLYDTKYIT